MTDTHLIPHWQQPVLPAHLVPCLVFFIVQPLYLQTCHYDFLDASIASAFYSSCAQTSSNSNSSSNSSSNSEVKRIADVSDTTASELTGSEDISKDGSTLFCSHSTHHFISLHTLCHLYLMSPITPFHCNLTFLLDPCITLGSQGEIIKRE